MNKGDIEVFKAAVALWGEFSQSDMMIEEMAELTKELIKRRRGRDNREEVIEEIVDVEIMLAQMKFIFCASESGFVNYEKKRDEKIARLKARLRGKGVDL